MSVHQRLGPPVGQLAPSRMNVPRTSGTIIDGDVRIGRGGRFQEGHSAASHQSTTGGPSRSAYRSPPRHFNGPPPDGPSGPMHHSGAGGHAGTNPPRRPPHSDAASSPGEERTVQICANQSLLIEFKNELCKQSPAHTQSHGASGYAAGGGGGGGGGIQHSASASRGNASQNRVAAASSRPRTQTQRSAASLHEPGPVPHRGYSHQPPLQPADVAAPPRLPAARMPTTQQPQSGQPFTKRGSDGRRNGPSRPRAHHEDAQQQSPMQQEFDYLPPSWGKGNSQWQNQDSQLQVEERAPSNVRGRGGAGGGRGSLRDRQPPSRRQSARGSGRRQISERTANGDVQSPKPARGEKAVPPTETGERPDGLANSSGRSANQQGRQRGRGYGLSRRRRGRARPTAKLTKSTNGEPSTENPIAPSDRAPPSQPKTAAAATAPAGDEDSVAGDIEQLRLQIDMKNGAGQPTDNHSEAALEQRAEFEEGESTEGESEEESSSSSESEFTEDTEEEKEGEEDGEEEEEEEEDQDQEPSLTEKPDVADENTLKQAAADGAMVGETQSASSLPAEPSEGEMPTGPSTTTQSDAEVEESSMREEAETKVEEQETTSPHGDTDSKAASESTLNDPDEDATAEATEGIQSGDEEKATEQQHSEADTPTVSPTPEAKVEEQETTSSHDDTDSKPADESSLGGLNEDGMAEASENLKSGYDETDTAQQHSEPDCPRPSPAPETKVEAQETTSSQGEAHFKPTDESTSDAPNGDATAEATENIQSGDEEKATPQQHSGPDASTPPPTASPTASHDAEDVTAGHSPEEDVGNSEGHAEEPSNDLDETHRSGEGSNRAPTPQQTLTKPQEPQSPASSDTNCTVADHPTGSGDNPEKSPRSPKDTQESNSKSNLVSTPQRVSTNNRKSKRGPLELSSLVANRLLRDYRPILCDREPRQPPPLDCQMPCLRDCMQHQKNVSPF
nr:unnamed protein product [Spirometra erinaceieuropaei]